MWKKKRKIKNPKISFHQKTLSSKFHEVSPATAQKSIIKNQNNSFHRC